VGGGVSVGARITRGGVSVVSDNTRMPSLEALGCIIKVGIIGGSDEPPLVSALTRLISSSIEWYSMMRSASAYTSPSLSF
jgi:hypothetical protein